jgi:hypothetical protein
LLISYNGICQTNKVADLEKQAVKQYSALLSQQENNSDSVEVYSERFSKNFQKNIRNNPATMDYNFKALKDSNFCSIQTSRDGNFRVYSWDTWTDGTMHFFKTIFQYRYNGQVFTKIPVSEEGDPGSIGVQVFTVNLKGKTIYLNVTDAIGSSKDVAQSIRAYSIENGKLVDTVKVFKTKTKTLNAIDVEYDFFSVVDRPERPVRLITYDENKQMIYIPVVNDKSAVTKRRLCYQLKGDYFEYIGVDK